MIAAFGAGTWMAQLGALAIVGLFTTVVTVALVHITKVLVGFRVDAETEHAGLDLAQHGESAYDHNS